MENLIQWTDRIHRAFHARSSNRTRPCLVEGIVHERSGEVL